MTIADELARLEELRNNGSLTEIEFEEAKRKALDDHNQAGNPYAATTAPQNVPGQIHGMDEKTWCGLMHLSQLLNWSGLGIIVPIAMWIMSKDESEFARRNGAAMINWFISFFIYTTIAVILCFFLIGIPILIVLGILEIVFPIIACIKAMGGNVWPYPMTIRFLDEN